MLNFDCDKMPTLAEPNVEMINVAGDIPAVSIKYRQFQEKEDFFTIEGIESQIRKIEDDIMMRQTHLAKWKEILKWAKAHDKVIALNEAEGHFFEFFKGHAQQLKTLEELKKPTPQQILEKKKLKENMEKQKAELRPAMKGLIEDLIQKILNAKA